jgi:PAS domain S-box-containing protein
MKIYEKLLLALLSVLLPSLGAEAFLLARARPGGLPEGWAVALFLVSVGLAAVGVATFLGRHLGAPIERILRQTRSLSKGGERPGAGRTRDELRLLAEAFAAMAERIRRRERELEEHRARLEDILRALPEGVCVSWGPESTSMTLNRAAEELLDFPISSTSGERVSAPEVGSWRGLAVIQRLLASAEPREAEVEIAHRSGRRVPVRVTATPTHDRSGRATGGVAVIQDMSAVKEREARLQSAWEQERQVAETLQQSFMPRAMPDVPEFEFGHDYRPALHRERVGGDFYDAVALDARRLAFCIGDVSGKGMQAALYTAMVKNMWRGFVAEDAHPGTLMERLNEALARYMEPEHFVTMVSGVIDRASGELQYSVAGHPAPLLRRAGGGCEALAGGGLVLGAMPGIRYEAEEIRLAVGDLLLLYTDGMSELRRDHEMLEVAGLSEWLRECPAEAPEEVVRALYDRAREWSGDRLHDDIALVALRCRLLAGAASAETAAPSGKRAAA